MRAAARSPSNCSWSSKATLLTVGERIYSPNRPAPSFSVALWKPTGPHGRVSIPDEHRARLRWGGGFWKTRRERRAPPNGPVPPNGRRPRARPALLWAATGAPERCGATSERRETGALVMSRPFMVLFIIIILGVRSHLPVKCICSPRLRAGHCSGGKAEAGGSQR